MLQPGPLQNFTIRDVSGALIATLLFAVVLYAPGYVLGWAADLFHFRSQNLAQQSVWALAYSFACAPVLAYLAGRMIGLNGICYLFAALATVTALLIAKNATRLTRPARNVVSLFALGWTVFVLLVLVDIQYGHRIFYSVVLADQSYRVAFTDTIVRTGIPPANPLYFPAASAPLHYYYFWNILCAVVVKLGHVSSRAALMASSVWAGFGLSAVVYLFTQYFFQWSAKRAWIAQGLLFVTGVDLVPALGNAVVRHTFNGDIEWWSVDPIDSWTDSLLWVPHHVASAICCVFAWLLLWQILRSSTRRERILIITIASISCASAFGLSAYVAAGFALIVIAWLVAFNQPVRRQLLLPIVAMGAAAILLSVPYLDQLCCGIGTSSVAKQCHILCLCVRQTIDAGLITGLPALAPWNHAHPFLLDQLIRLLLLVPGMAMELGVYGVVLVLFVIARRRNGRLNDPARDCAIFFSIVGLFIVSFIGSSIISNNDFGYRAALLPQFFLVLLAADLLGSWWLAEGGPLYPRTSLARRCIYATLALGVAGTAYGSVLLRSWLPIEAAQTHGIFNDLPSDAYQLRSLFAELDAHSPASSVVAIRTIDPVTNRDEVVITPDEFYQRLLVMDTGRQILNAEHDCATQFGGDPRPCAAIQSATQALYALPAPSVDDAHQFCARFSVSYLLIGRHDPAWQSATGWPVTLPTVAQQPSYKILNCATTLAVN